MSTSGSHVSLENSHSELLNTLYTCSLDVDKKLVRYVKVSPSYFLRLCHTETIRLKSNQIRAPDHGGGFPIVTWTRIHSGDGPVSDHQSQEGKGQQRVEQ